MVALLLCNGPSPQWISDPMGLFVCMMCGVSLSVPYAAVHRCRRHGAAHAGDGEGCVAFVRMAAAHRLRRGVWIMLPFYTECNGGRGMVTSLNVEQFVDGGNDAIMRVVRCHERASVP